MSRRDGFSGYVRDPSVWLRLVVGICGSVMLLGSLIYFAGPAAVQSRLQQIAPPTLFLVIGCGLLVVGLRTTVATVLYSTANTTSPAYRFELYYPMVWFFRAILPGGYATGSACTGYVVSRIIPTKFEPIISALVITESLNTLLSLLAAGVGAALLSVSSSVSRHPIVLASLGISTGSLLAITGLIAVYRAEWAWGRLTRGIKRIVTNSTIIAQSRRLLGNRSSIESTILAETFGRIRQDHRTLGAAIILTISYLVLSAVPLVISIMAMGESISLAAVALVLPVSRLGGLIPVPGGVGSIEGTLATLLVLIGGLSIQTATAATLVYRLATFWLGSIAGILAGLALFIVHAPTLFRISREE